MAKFLQFLFVLGIAGAVLFYGASAQAQLPRTWVSASGSDANGCGLTAPCKTFNGAIAKTASGGQVTCLDAGDFGDGSTVNITKSIAISCNAGTAGVYGGGITAITVNVAGTDKVYLRGIDVEGGGTGNVGIAFTGAGELHVENCLIRGFSHGIEIFNTAAAALYVADTVAAENGVSGIWVATSVGATGANLSVSLERVQVTNNGNGIYAVGTTSNATIVVTITDSIASNNSGIGFRAGSAGWPVLMQIDRSTASQNGTGVLSESYLAQIILGGSLVSQNGTGVGTTGLGTLYSYQNNQINGNGTDGTPIPPVALH